MATSFVAERQLPLKFSEEILSEALARLKSSSIDLDESACFSQTNWNLLRQAGFLGLLVPQTYGGSGLKPVEWLDVVRRLGGACPSTGLSFLMHLCATSVILATASGELKARILPRVAAGELTVAYAGTEHTTGTNFWALASCAEPIEGGWHLKLAKDWATLAEVADLFVVPTRAHPQAAPAEISLFLVDRSAGVLATSEWRGTGMRASSSGAVTIDAVVPDLHLLGVPGRANDYITTDMFNLLLLSHAALYLGIAEEAFSLAVQHANHRTFGHLEQRLSGMTLWQSRLGESAAEIAAVSALLESAAQRVSTELALGVLLPEALAVKLKACAAARHVTDFALQISGGTGYNRGTRVEMLWRDARAGSLMRPTDEVAGILLGRLATGQPPFLSESGDNS